MIKHTQTIRRQKGPNCLGVLDHFVELALTGLNRLLFTLFDKLSYNPQITQNYASEI